jgi:hypothetical protein
VGAGDLMWDHLTTAKLNSEGAVYGGRDEPLFTSFIKKQGLKILSDETDPDVPQPPLPAEEAHKPATARTRSRLLSNWNQVGRPRRGGCRHLNWSCSTDAECLAAVIGNRDQVANRLRPAQRRLRRGRMIRDGSRAASEAGAP